jgi:hypothetical protein
VAGGGEDVKIDWNDRDGPECFFGLSLGEVLAIEVHGDHHRHNRAIPHMTHSELIAALMLEFSRGDGRLMRANVGRGWTGRIISQDRTRIVLSPYRPFHGHDEGVLDLIGWKGPTFVAIDAKTGSDRVRPAQQRFIDLVVSAGGRAGIARSVEDARLIITGRQP